MERLNEVMEKQNDNTEYDWKCIKKVNLFIPYRVIVLECIIQDITNLNSFFSSIMKVVQMGITDINIIQKILGLKGNIINEVIADMVHSNLVFLKESQLTLTTIGAKALLEDKQIEKDQTRINRIVVNMITGELIYEEDVHFNRISRYDIFLEEKFVITEQHLKQKFDDLKQIYEKIQRDDNKYFNNSAITKELYKIINIDKDYLKYRKVKLEVFENIASNEIELRVDDKADNIYANEVIKQIKLEKVGVNTFFERNWTLISKINQGIRPIVSKETEYIHTMSRPPLYINEHKDYFIKHKKLDFDEIYIEISKDSRYIFELIDYIGSISKYKKIYVNYQESDWINGFKKRLLECGDKDNIILKKSEIIKEHDIITFYPYASINLCYSGSKYMGKVISYIDSHMFLFKHEKNS